jgi:hypothetical protein
LPSSFSALKSGDLLAGDAPNKVLRQARRWVEQHRAEPSAMGASVKKVELPPVVALTGRTRGGALRAGAENQSRGRVSTAGTLLIDDGSFWKLLSFHAIGWPQGAQE